MDGLLLSGIKEAGYETCTEVQEKVMPLALDGSDLYVQSQTGTGKTAAYLIPIIQELITKKSQDEKVLVMVPTRELAVQVEEEAKTLISHTQYKAVSVYGGVGYEKQISAIKKGATIIIGTPGRLIDLCKGGNLSLKNASYIVIDEADRMFDMGFYPDLREILKHVPKSENRQTMLFSATLNSYVKNLAWEYTRDAKEIEIKGETITVSEIAQELIHVSSDDKMKLLIGILKSENPESVIIFCNTKRSCEVVAKRLRINDIKADFIIGDLPQFKRLKVLNNFKAGELKVLVATDVAARGLDINDLAMVINYDLPNEAENYVHRIGRTARAGKSGKAYTFCSEQDVYSLPAIERYIEMQLPSCVAYPEQMAEDKSKNIYIKTEYSNRDDDDFKSNHTNRKDKRSDKKGKFDKKPHYDNKSRHNNKTRQDNKSRYDNGNNYKKTDYKKPKKDFSKSQNATKTVKHNLDFDKMENMSFDERMKLYRKKYGTPKPKNENRHYEKHSKNDKFAENENQSSKATSKMPQTQPQKQMQSQKTGEKQQEKRGFFQKVKSFFGR